MLRRGLEPVFRKLRTKAAYGIRAVMRHRNNPHQIALGFSVGAFIGVFPTFGLGLFLVAALAVWFKYHIPAAVIGTAVANPFTAPFWIYLSCQTGNTVFSFFGMERLVILENGILKQFFSTFIDFIIGNTILSILTAIIGYFLVLNLVKWSNRKKMIRRNRYRVVS